MTNITLLLIIGVGLWLAFVVFNAIIDGIVYMIAGFPYRHRSRPPVRRQSGAPNGERR